MTETQQDWAAQVERDMRMTHMISRAEHDARVAAAVAAALREAAQDVQDWADCECAPSLDLIRNGVLSLIPDAGAALDRALREAKARGMERAGAILLEHPHSMRWHVLQTIRAEAAAIRAQEGE